MHSRTKVPWPQAKATLLVLNSQRSDHSDDNTIQFPLSELLTGMNCLAVLELHRPEPGSCHFLGAAPASATQIQTSAQRIQATQQHHTR